MLLALLVRLATYPLSGIEAPAYFEYGYIAHNIVDGNGYSTIHWLADTSVIVPSAWMPPGQVMVTTAFFTAFGEGHLGDHMMFLFNALLGTLTVYVLARCTNLITGNSNVMVIALYAAALFPPFISTSPTWGIATSVLFLNSLTIYRALLFSRALSSGSNVLRHSILFGLIAGILALFRAEAPLTIAFILLGLLIYHRNKLSTSLSYLALSGSVMLATLSPWMIYNYSRFDALILGSTSGGYNLWRGNNPNATGGGWGADGSTVLPDRELQHVIWERIKDVPPTEFERAYSSELARAATNWIEQAPGQALILSLKKVLLIWVVDLYHPSELRYLYGLFQVAAIALAVFGIITLKKRGIPEEIRRWLWIAGGACLAATLLTMVFFSLPRYQIFLVGLYFPMVAIGMHALLRKMGLLMDDLGPPVTVQN